MLCKAIMSLSISLSTKLRECLACKKKRGGISLETIIFSLFLWYCSWYVYLHLVLTKKMLFTSSEKGPNSWMADMGFSKYTMIISGRSSAEEDNQFWTCNGLEKKVNHAQFAIAVKDWNHQVMKKILYMLFLSLPLSLPFDHSLVFILLPSTPLYISLPSFSCPFPSCNRKKNLLPLNMVTYLFGSHVDGFILAIWKKAVGISFVNEDIGPRPVIDRWNFILLTYKAS